MKSRTLNKKKKQLYDSEGVDLKGNAGAPSCERNDKLINNLLKYIEICCTPMGILLVHLCLEVIELRFT